MKLKFDFKNKKADFEANVEKIVEKGMEYHEKDWKDKFETKHNAKKEMLEMKHKQRLELKNRKNKRQIEIEEQIRLEQEEKIKKQQNNQIIIRNISIILILFYGLLSVTGFDNGRIIAAVISSIQCWLLVMTIFMCENIFHLFEKEYKILFIISNLLIIFWVAFAS